jgi:5-(aminomethyl)-3-furanmethanol phosphate kinase
LIWEYIVSLVVKVGGSLFDWPDLGPRLRDWLDRHAPPETILVPGGGRIVEVIRDLDRMHGLGDEVAHRMALRAMTMNADLLGAIIPDSCIIDGPDLAELVWEQGRRPILDAFAFCESDDANPGALPHTWDVTSDSISARLAVVAGASELMLLKSTAPPTGDANAWAAAGYVDSWLPGLLEESGIHVRAVNLRDG